MTHYEYMDIGYESIIRISLRTIDNYSILKLWYIHGNRINDIHHSTDVSLYVATKFLSPRTPLL